MCCADGRSIPRSLVLACGVYKSSLEIGNQKKHLIDIVPSHEDTLINKMPRDTGASRMQSMRCEPLS